MKNTARLTALKDIAAWIKEQNLNTSGLSDIWVVTPNQLDTKEQRALNRELGVHRLNYLGNTNGFRKH